MWKHYKFDPKTTYFSHRSDEQQFSKLDEILHSEWDRAVEQKLFSFEVDKNIKKRTLDGELNYAIELTPNRYQKRRAPYPFESVKTPFDSSKFNFNKIKDEEVLLSLDDEEQTDKHLVLINNSPIRRYQVLLVPSRELEQSQILTIDCILFGLRFIVSSAYPFMYAGFNSLCGYASLNHLHLHGIYMPHRLFIQTMKCPLFHAGSSCYLYDILDVQGFAFEAKNTDEFDRIARSTEKITNYFVSSEIAYNMAMMKGDSFSSSYSEPVIRIFVWYRQKYLGAKSFERHPIGCLEFSGYTFFQYEDVFDNMTESTIREFMNAEAVSTEEQNKIKEDVKNLLDQ